MLHIFRTLLWALLFPLSAVLLGLTAYRLHYTKKLNNGGDLLTSRSHFYDPIVVELLVTSVLSLLFSLWFIPAILSRMRNPLSRYLTEHIALWILWLMFLIGASIFTHKWLHLKQCRRYSKVCRILETIKAFSWMCFIVSTFLILLSLFNMFFKKSRVNDPLHGQDEYGTYPETRQTRTTNTTTTAYNNSQPLAQASQPVNHAVVEPAPVGTTGTSGKVHAPAVHGTTAPHGTTMGTTNVVHEV